MEVLTGWQCAWRFVHNLLVCIAVTMFLVLLVNTFAFIGTITQPWIGIATMFGTIGLVFCGLYTYNECRGWR